ncbi:type II secretion system protein [Filibacter tadaridae]|uniref:Prepilin-type N-terminal cleavage/methylation domain-containing protein n=1 Tax=Filibacter tadaridae TaxID=2483811 RepID=A0A3P5XQE0_9BACL|nr:type II secretion system protein [Filibacter tadaridae]VDC32629.1 hypothetical protein FILTAD_02831 [Filibacter tadaridae]
MQSEKGFSLLEVVASLVIISIVLLSFYPFFINAKTMSDSNMERLVVINLADATLERLKADPYAYIEKPSTDPDYLSIKSGEKVYSNTNCQKDGVVPDPCIPFSIELNGENYFVVVKSSQTNGESESKLIEILVTVKNESGKINYSVEGYIPYGQASTK